MNVTMNGRFEAMNRHIIYASLLEHRGCVHFTASKRPFMVTCMVLTAAAVWRLPRFFPSFVTWVLLCLYRPFLQRETPSLHHGKSALPALLFRACGCKDLTQQYLGRSGTRKCGWKRKMCVSMSSLCVRHGDSGDEIKITLHCHHGKQVTHRLARMAGAAMRLASKGMSVL